MIFFFVFFCLLLSLNQSQTIKQLNEISINEELPIGTIVTFLTDKIPNLDQALEYDLVTPLSPDLDLFTIDHIRHSLNIKKRIDFEHLCSKIDCHISISIAVSNQDKIDVYILPIRIKNIDDNPTKFPVNRTVIEIEENDVNWLNKSYSLPQATDADGDLITYSLYLQNWNKPNGLFELDQTNLLLKPLKQFDREQQNLYLLRLVAHNKHQKDVSIDVIVLIKDVNDNPPVCQYHQRLFSINQIHSISIFSLNVTDADEGDNGKLEYRLLNPFPGFTIDRFSGDIKFDYTKWIRQNQSKLFVNITDHGKPVRLSTECIAEFTFTFLYDINLKSDYGRINKTDVMINIQDVNLPIGQLFIFDKQEKRSCLNCLIQLNSSLSEMFILDEKTFDLYLNLNSMILIRILSNYLIKKEYLPVMIEVNVSDRDNALIQSSKTYSIILNFNKENLLMRSNMLFLKIDENILLNEKISIFNHYHYCLRNLSKEFILIDPTNTFRIDNKYNLILTKYLNIKQQENYLVTLKELRNNQTNEMNQCSIQLRLHVFNPYSITNNSPYFSQSFYILTSNNMTQFSLPSLPSYVKYISSKPNEISIDEQNGSIKIQSPSLFSSYSYDFDIKAIDSQTPSLTCSIPIRILFGINQQAPRLHTNLTKQTIEISSSGFVYQIEGYDPDLSINNQKGMIPPSIEYEIDSLINFQIEPYSGRIFLQAPNQTMLSSSVNFTLIMTDFGQPDRLITRQRFIFDIISNEKINRQEISMVISTTLIIISACVFLIIILFILILLCYCKKSRKKSLSSNQTSWKNISPTTPDTRLIDNEYITTTTSLPRVVNREQRIYPTLSYENQRKLLSNLSLDKINLPPPPLYSAEKVYIKHDHQQHLSMNDINKYLERFEKIYNNSSEQNFHEPVGSVV